MRKNDIILVYKKHVVLSWSGIYFFNEFRLNDLNQISM